MPIMYKAAMYAVPQHHVETGSEKSTCKHVLMFQERKILLLGLSLKVLMICCKLIPYTYLCKGEPLALIKRPLFFDDEKE